MFIIDEHLVKSIDQKAIISGLSENALIENAGRSIALFIKERLKPKRVIGLIGPGNNGADAICALRWLNSYEIDVLAFIPKEPKSKGLQDQISIYKALNLKITKNFPESKDFDVLIDGLYGNSFKPPLKEEDIPLIEFINSFENVVSVDVPSGLSKEINPDKNNIFVRPKYTIAFSFFKDVHINPYFSSHMGDIFLIDIGLKSFLEKHDKNLIRLKDINLPKRKELDHKHKTGKVLIIGGNKYYSGALVMAAKSASKAGAGLVYCAFPEEHSFIESALIEQIKLPIKSRDKLIDFESFKDIDLSKFDAIAIGMGFGVYEDGKKILEHILQNYEKRLLLDADALNTIASFNMQTLLDRENIVITPHIGEFSRLFNIDSHTLLKDQISITLEKSKELRSIIVLKGPITTIGISKEVFVSNIGPHSLSKGGTGDVLSGIIASFLSRDISMREAVIGGVFLHSISALFGTYFTSYESLSPMDIIENISKSFNFIESFEKNKKNLFEKAKEITLKEIELWLKTQSQKH